MAADVSVKGFLKRWGLFGLVVVLVLAAYAAYLANMVQWKDATDYGWRAMYDSGPHVVDEVFPGGAQAGLLVGDTILAINGRPYSTFDELFFQVRTTEPGEGNTYTVLRDTRAVDIHVTNGTLGFAAVVKRSVPLFVVGLLYFFLGALVFYMKPRTEKTWVFLAMTAALGISISYASPSDLMRPLWLFKFRQFIDILLPALILHLGLIFPVRRKFLDKGRWGWTAPYIPVLLIILFFRPFASTYWDPPPFLDLVNNVYLLLAVVAFMALTLVTILRSDSLLARVRSRVILFGASLGMLIPVLELMARRTWGVILFPDPALFFMIFLALFPLSIGYSIVKHNLFDVDVFIRRAVGYGLMTLFVGGLYVGLAASVGPAARRIPALDEVSGLYPAFFALLVVFFFRPLHFRLQKVIDRVFFREKVEYKDSILAISEALTSVLDLDEVMVRILHAVRDVMQIDAAGLVLLQPEVETCQALFIYDCPESGKEEVEEECLTLDDPLITLAQRERKLVTRYDVREHQGFMEVRDACLDRMQALRVYLLLPLMFQGRVTGLLLAGRKKSGKIHTRGDIELLMTLAGQGAVALENARRAESMRDEEVVRTRLSRYLSPQVVDQVVHNPMAMELGGVKKNVTVLISDIRGFTRLSMKWPPEIMAKILNEYFTEMAEAIFENRGSLDKYVGDAVVAVFGSLIELDNHTVNAVKTALDMVGRMGSLNRRWADDFEGFHMDIGIGIDTGEVFLGNVGSP